MRITTSWRSNSVRRTSGDDFEIDVFAESPSYELGMYYDTITATLIDCTRRLYTLVGFSMPDSFQRLLEEFEKLRAEATPILST